MKRFVWVILALSFISMFTLSSCDSTDNKPPINSNQQTTAETNDNGNTSDDPIVCQHSFGEWNIVKEASCKEVGKRARSCNICEEVEEESISKSKTHTPVTDAAIPATCKNTGLTEGSHCSVCNKVLVAQTVVPKTEDHTPVIDAAIPATCKSTGLTEGSHCSVCNKVLVAQTVVPKTEDHTPVTDAAIPATCKNAGLTEGSHCSVCNKVLVAQTVVPKTEDHAPVTDAAIPATCKSTGLTEGSHCSVCNEVLVAQTVVPKTEDHTPVTDAAIPATCKSTGLTEGSHCSVCNKVLVAQTVVPKTEDHAPVTDVAIPATCKNTGLTEGSHCSVCNKIFVKQVETPKEPHNYIDGYCDFCKEKKVSEGLKYENYDGYASVVGIGSCTDTFIIIPDVAPSGLPVKEIGMQAFQNCTNIKEVIIPNSVEAILIEAFINCTSLENITLPAAYLDMQPSTFKNCTALKEVIIPNNVFRVGVACFENCTSLENVTIPTSVTTYSKDAFEGCSITNIHISSLDAWLDSKFDNFNANPLYCAENLYLNETLVTTIEINKNIPLRAFVGYDKLTKVVLGNSVKTIGNSAFYGCSGLTEVVFGNKVETIDGAAFYNCTKLNAIHLPSSLKTVLNSAFYGCSSLQTVTVASGLHRLGDYAFSGCSSLRAIDLPSTITYMGISSFEKCASLESITIPFAGVGTCKGQYEAFGSLFGRTQYEGGEMITQLEGLSGEYSYCIPKALKHVKILKQDVNSSTRAFVNCKYIERITFGKGIERVGSNSFLGCTALTDIYYEGTKEEWKNLRYSESFNSIETLTITCSDGVLEKE